MVITELSPGDEWPHHYRGLALQVSPNEDVWWQLYQGTDRLHLDPIPTDIVDTLLEYKRIGGRIHITEGGAVLTQVEQGDDEYKQIYVGDTTITGTLTPPENKEYSIDIRPEGLSPGDLWSSVYDGARYSFVEDRIWWQNGQTHRRHSVATELPTDIIQELRSYKPSGGSFRITPWGDVITLIDMHPAPETVEKQFGELPRVVKNIIRLRKEREVEMLPVYVGTIKDPEINVKEPKTLTDKLSDDKLDELSSWAKNLGRTTETSTSAHEASDNSNTGPSERSGSSSSKQKSSSTESGSENEEQEDERPSFEDDPLTWIEDEVRAEEETE